MTGWVDCGVNLTNGAFRERVPEILNASISAGVDRWVLIGTSLEETRAAIKLAEQYPGCIVTAGIHPHDASNAPDDFAEQLRKLASHPAVRAIGECGLDFNRNYSAQDDQIKVFLAQLQLAAELELPVYLHERDALDTQTELLGEFKGRIPRMLAHCFTGGNEALAKYNALECHIGVTGWVCDERRGGDLQQAVPEIPTDKLVIETDAPFLMPRTIRPRPKSRHNIPAHIPHIAEVLAELRNESIDALRQQTTENALNFFGDWPAAVRQVR